MNETREQCVTVQGQVSFIYSGNSTQSSACSRQNVVINYKVSPAFYHLMSLETIGNFLGSTSKHPIFKLSITLGVL